jgi:hypothetical protein
MNTLSQHISHLSLIDKFPEEASITAIRRMPPSSFRPRLADHE